MGRIARMLGFDSTAMERVQSEAVQREAAEADVPFDPLIDWLVPNWQMEQGLTPGFWAGNGLLAERVWICNRCIQMNSQQIASMPLKFEGPPSVTQPAWVSANADAATTRRR